MKTWRADVARWVWLEGDERPANAYVRFRRRFELKAPPATATVYASADCRYLLFVNGQVAGRGPTTTDPRYKQVDVYEVASLLRPGENVIAALVLQRQVPGTRLCPVRGGFILQFDSPDLRLGTDAAWKAQWADDHRGDVPMMTHQYGHQEWVDGRKTPVGWESPGFDDRAWAAAAVVADATQFWPAELEVRTVPHMRRVVVHPQALIAFFGLSTNGRPPEQDPEPAWNILTGYAMTSVKAEHPERIVHPERGAATFTEINGDGVGIVVDLGAECYGFPFIDIECPAGAVVDIGHGEVLSRNRIQTVLMPRSQAEQCYGDRYITREGRQRFELFDTKGCRYLEIHFNRLADFYTGARVVVHAVGIVNSVSPFELGSEFRCPDERLNRVWAICRHTAEVKCQDWHICDAQREQNNWPDVIQDLLYWQCFGRVEMVRQMIHQFTRLQLPDGFILSLFPMGDRALATVTARDTYVATTFIFPLIVYVDWLYAGEDDRQPFWLDACGRIFSALHGYVGPAGTLANLPGSQFVEWTGLDARDPGRGVERSWEMPLWNALLVLAQEKLAEMAEAHGRGAQAVQWRAQAAALREAANRRYWSEERQAYPDGIYDGAMSPVLSQTTNAAAVLARLGEESRLRAALRTVADPERCQVQSGINQMMHYHEALQSLDMDAGVPDRFRRKWGAMLDHGATTTWEGENALEASMGLCFAFAAHPLPYLTRTALGVTPIEPGYRRFSVRVVPHGLTEAQGRVATPHGYIEAAWRWDGALFALALTVPEGTTAHVAPPRLGGTAKAQTWQAKCGGRPARMAELPVALCTFLRADLPAIAVGPGSHQIAFAAST
ncbi:MAG: family 78 glycoside hydrolase catalytic domain [Kiritimatiellae bacterium]|nr:family 78 glycoside hydrolase catalytic domain [Kiritimatiellia bacterium]